MFLFKLLNFLYNFRHEWTTKTTADGWNGRTATSTNARNGTQTANDAWHDDGSKAA